MGRLSRDKGKRGERIVVALFEAHGVDAARGVQHKGTPDSPDVTHGLLGWRVEVKNTGALRLREALLQAAADCAPGERPIVMWIAPQDGPHAKRLPHQVYAILPADDLLGVIT